MHMAWITWEHQVRNKTISRKFGAELIEMKEDKPRLLRYLLLTLHTFPLLFREKYQVIFTQNPSLVLSLLNVLVAKISGKIAIIDAHNSGVYPAAGKYKLLTSINDFILRNADFVIVSNVALSKVIAAKRGKPVVLPDPIPLIDYQIAENSIDKSKFSLIFVCSWAEDEPYMEVIEAAKDLPQYVLYITGKYQKKLTEELVSRLPENIKLTGYLPDAAYEQLLQSVDVVIDLTTRENCMVCGAYEAAATGTPAILSDHSVNRNYFKPGYLYTKNDKESIATAMLSAASSIEQLKVDISVFSKQAKIAWDRDMSEFLADIASSSGKVHKNI